MRGKLTTVTLILVTFALAAVTTVAVGFAVKSAG